MTLLIPTRAAIIVLFVKPLFFISPFDLFSASHGNLNDGYGEKGMLIKWHVSLSLCKFAILQLFVYTARVGTHNVTSIIFVVRDVFI